MEKKGQMASTLGTIGAVVAIAIGIIVVAVALSTAQNITSGTGNNSLGLTSQQQNLFSSSYTLLLVAVIATIGAVAVGAFFFMAK